MALDRSRVWAPHPRDGFILGTVVDIGPDSVTVQPYDTKEKAVSASFDRVFPAEDGDKLVEDNCALMHLSEATLLHNIKQRYLKDRIYTYVANILIAVNPYFEMPALYSKEAIKSYNGKSLGTMPPHVFAVGDKAYREMMSQRLSQSVIVSGESGSGKTESTKYLIKYITESWGPHVGSIEGRIQDSNPLLEAFGNAKTVRNNNSSRFGKFVEIHFDAKNSVCGGYVSHYLLEKSRVCIQAPLERNYHIFYQLCAGAPEPLRQQLALLPPDQYHYLNRGCTQFFLSAESEKVIAANRRSAEMAKKPSLRDVQIDDIRNFQNTLAAMSLMGFSDADRTALFSVVAGLLHLGNVTFEDDPDDQKGGCRLRQTSAASLNQAASLLGLDKDDLHQSLKSRVMQAIRSGVKGTAIMVPLKVGEAHSARDALAKAIYKRLFDHVVTRVNQALPFAASKSFIGVLDIAGFEYFEDNSFEQFCINYCNEKLQQFFNMRILKEEQLLYEKEGLGVKKTEYIDNADCIELIEGKGCGVFDLLDEESRLPRPMYDHFTLEVQAKNKGHFRLALPRKSKLKAHRDIRDDAGFVVRHYAGAVCYQTAQFLDKNNDALHASLEVLGVDSSSALVKALFSDVKSAGKTGKLNLDSVGSKFRAQLQQLLEKLSSTGTSFVRCMKPNARMADHCFEGSGVLSQLECSGMHSVLDLMQQGYPSRTSFAELYSMYKQYLPPELARLDPRMFCKSLFKALGLNEVDFKFGLTKVFFRPGKFAEFDQILKSDPASLAALVAKVKRWLIRARFRKAQYGALEAIKLARKIAYRRSALVRIQSAVRMWLCIRHFRHRYKGLQKVKVLRAELAKMAEIVGKLKQDQAAANKKKDDLARALDALIVKIQSTPITDAAIRTEHTGLVEQLTSQLTSLQRALGDQQIREEQERLRRIQEEMERVRRQKEAEERRRLEEDELRRQKAELEVRRKKEEEEQRRRDEEARRAEALLVEQRRLEAEEEERQRRAQEQERHDRELALRLAAEDQSQVEEAASVAGAHVAAPPPDVKKGGLPAATVSSTKKQQDLSKWKYADLRDIINTSCDVELLKACQEEFHRRLKVYQEWKTKNKSKGQGGSPAPPDGGGAPAMIEEARQSQRAGGPSAESGGGGGGGSTAAAAAAEQQQHYFRIPFLRPGEHGENLGGGAHVTGWWYAHFDGKWIARQMELHPGKVPLLLVAGADDMQMCELELDATGLKRKRGAEILAQEFEEAWSAHGGREYLRGLGGDKVASRFLRKTLALPPAPRT